MRDGAVLRRRVRRLDAMRLGAALAVASCLSLAACGGSGGGASMEGGVPGGRTLEQLWHDGGDAVAIVPGTKHYVPGDVRVSFLVVDSHGRPLSLPTAHVWLSRGLDAQPFLETEAHVERIGVPGGDEADSTHIYVLHFRVQEPGTYWLLAEPVGGGETVRAVGEVKVVAHDSVPVVGERPPPSRTPTLASTGGNVAQLTTRVPPDRDLLRSSVADSLRAKVPFVVAFATPKFCQSRTCGPVVDVVEQVAKAFRSRRVRFIHVEVYERNDPARGYNRWMRDWHLDTEPWTFVVNGQGRVSARFEGALSVRELTDAVGRVLGSKR
jgi:hypothetical protein